MRRNSIRVVLAFVVAVSVAAGAAAQWTQWRGAARDGVAGAFAAPKAWPEKLKKVWSLEAGGGHSTPVVADGKAYLLARQGDQEAVSSVDLATGKVLWKDSYPASFSPKPEARSHGTGPFSTPTLHAGVLYTFGINEVLSAYDAESGKLLWRNDHGKAYEVPHPYYGASLSPLLADGRLIVHVGGPGKGSLLSLDPKTGQTQWKLDGEGPSYSSPVVADFGGVRQVVVMAQQSLMGVDLAKGEKLWQMPFAVPYDQTILTPVVLGDTFIVSGEDTDAQAIRVAKKEGKWSTEKVWSNRAVTMYMSTPVLAGGLLYGFSTFQRGHTFCLDPKSGEVRWKTEGGQGENAHLVAAGNFIFLLKNDAEMTVLQKTGEAYRQVAKYTVADAATWAHPVVLDGGRFLIKDAGRLTLWSL